MDAENGNDERIASYINPIVYDHCPLECVECDKVYGLCHECGFIEWICLKGYDLKPQSLKPCEAQ